ncbi:MAG: CHAD domain-containing protein, partial [Lentisphaerae bacterium]|nr:CHAD domain-containing protein [Lentisphaerota bacterium]
MKKTTPYYSAFIRSVLETRLAVFRNLLPSCDTLPAPEQVHRLRVAGRRLRCGLAAGAEALPGKTARDLDKALRRLARKSGRLRDIDVKILLLLEMLKQNSVKDHLPGLRR